VFQFRFEELDKGESGGLSHGLCFGATILRQSVREVLKALAPPFTADISGKAAGRIER
jgi:hypothetical protein